MHYVSPQLQGHYTGRGILNLSKELEMFFIFILQK